MTFAVDQELIDFIYLNLPSGKTILELGSGDGSTKTLSANYKVIAIEENEEWLNKYPKVQYIHAPLKAHKEMQNYSEYKQIWYDPVYLSAICELDYDFILVDGPSSQGSRIGLIKYFDLFKQDVPMLFDDLQRLREWKVVNSLSNRLQRPYTVYPSKHGKPFAFLHKV